MPKDNTKYWLYERSKEVWNSDDLTPEEIDWIMREEENQTTLLRWERDPASGGADQTPASGGKWFINDGNILTLAELVWWTHTHMSMFEVYDMWLTLPIFACRRGHSESQSEKAQYVRNAKQLQFLETGRWGLNEPRPRGRQRRG